MDDNAWYRWFKLMADAVTIIFWYPDILWMHDYAGYKDYFKMSLVYDGNLSTLFWMQWFLLIPNIVVFGIWTMFLFPLTATCISMNWFVWSTEYQEYYDAAIITNKSHN